MTTKLPSQPMLPWCKRRMKKGHKTIRKGPYIFCEKCSFKELA